MGEVAGLITSANLAVMSAWSEGKPIVGRHVSGRKPAPPVLSWLGLGLGLGLVRAGLVRTRVSLTPPVLSLAAVSE